MQNSTIPVVKDLVLVGGGHSQVTVLKRFGMRPVAGVRLTLICRDVHTPYSGMLPGFIAGHYEYDDAHIDLGPLARFANARFYHDEVVRIDLERKRLFCRNRPPVSYDILSINIGSTPATSSVPGAPEVVVPVKPIHRFVDRWERLRERVFAADRPLKIGVVGAGAGGVELVLAVQFALGQMLEKSRMAAKRPEFHLFSATEEILPTHNEKVRAKFRRVLDERSVHLHSGCRVAEVKRDSVRCEDGSECPVDEILWVTQAGAASWLGESGLDVDSRGFVRVDDTLQSTSHPGVFAAGDVAAVVNHPREKAGVFAVRQGKPLQENLRRALLGRALKRFVPQKKFLSLISTGDKYAVASRGNASLEGRYVWKWKDWIDRHFMNKYNVLPEMSEGENPKVPAGLAKADVLREISTAAMRCAGCGSKVGATVLDRVLDRLNPRQRDDVLIGLEAPDDSAVCEVPPGKVLIQTVDAFRAILEDPYVFGRITANHCLGDIFAMGGDPQSALAIVTVPYGLEEKVEETLEQMLRGAVEVLDEADASLVGGHTSEGAELSLGLAVTGFIDRESLLRKSGMKPGNRLILTKPIGIGTLFAADMRLKAKGRWIAAAIASMLVSNRKGAECLRGHGATALTDVTGFGVLGHLVEMTKASAVDARVFLEEIPLLDGALETVAAGIFSSLQPHNVRLRRAVQDVDAAAKNPRYPLLFDPQTAGGLLASVPSDRAAKCVVELKKLGYSQAAIIGAVEPRSERAEPIRIEES